MQSESKSLLKAGSFDTVVDNAEQNPNNALTESLLGNNPSKETTHFNILLKRLWEIAGITGPILATDLPRTLVDFINSSILAKVDPTDVSTIATGLIIPPQISYSVIPTGTSLTIGFLMAQFMERVGEVNQQEWKIKDGEQDHAKHLIKNGITLAIAVSIPLSILCYFMGEFYAATGSDEDVVKQVNQYFHIYAPSLPLQLTAVALQQTAVGLHQQKLLYITSIANFIATIAFSYCIQPGFFSSKTEIVAASYWISGLTRNLILALGIYYYSDILKNQNQDQNSHRCEAPRRLITAAAEMSRDILLSPQYIGSGLQDLASMFADLSRMCFADSKKAIKNNNPLLYAMLTAGATICVQIASELIAVSLLNQLVYLLPDDEQDNASAVLSVANLYNLFLVILPIALAQAAGNMIGHAKHEKEYDQIAPIGNTILGLGACYNAIFVILGLCLTHPLASVFADQETIDSENFKVIFTIIFTGLLINSTRDITLFALRSLNITKNVMYTSMFSLWLVGLPLAAVFAKFSDLGVKGIILGYYLGITVGASLLNLFWRNISQEKKAEAICTDEAIRKNADVYPYQELRAALWQSANPAKQALLSTHDDLEQGSECDDHTTPQTEAPKA